MKIFKNPSLNTSRTISMLGIIVMIIQALCGYVYNNPYIIVISTIAVIAILIMAIRLEWKIKALNSNIQS